MEAQDFRMFNDISSDSHSVSMMGTESEETERRNNRRTDENAEAGHVGSCGLGFGYRRRGEAAMRRRTAISTSSSLSLAMQCDLLLLLAVPLASAYP